MHQISTHATDDGFIILVMHRDHDDGIVEHGEVAFRTRDVALVAEALAGFVADGESRDVQLVDGELQIFPAGPDWAPMVALMLTRDDAVPRGGVGMVDVRIEDAFLFADALRAADERGAA